MLDVRRDDIDVAKMIGSGIGMKVFDWLVLSSNLLRKLQYFSGAADPNDRS